MIKKDLDDNPFQMKATNKKNKKVELFSDLIEGTADLITSFNNALQLLIKHVLRDDED